MPPKDEIRELIEIHNRRLLELKKQQAAYGLSVDPSIPLEIEKIETKIRELQADLQTESGGVKNVDESSTRATAIPSDLAGRHAQNSILVVEDDPTWQDILQEYLVEIGYLVEIAATFGEARRKLQTEQFNLVTIDAHLSQNVAAHEGMLLLDYIRNRLGSTFPIIIISGEINKRELVRAFKKFSVTSVLLKEHFEYDEFCEAVREALQAT